MTVPFEVQIALRYLLARRKQAFISVISLVSTLGFLATAIATVYLQKHVAGEANK